jgi:hypothetical protein
MATHSKKSKYARNRHPFWYKARVGNGTEHTYKTWARVIHAIKPVTLTLTAQHVERSIRENGRGDTAHCSMAICTYEHADAFPHPIAGHVDWNYSRAFVVSKVDKSGLPDECVAYEHRSSIARNQDKPGGQQKLLTKLQKYGDVTVELYPIRKRSRPGRSGLQRLTTGARLNQAPHLHGARLRYSATLDIGVTPKL